MAGLAEAAQRLADDLLAPTAQSTDQAVTVPQANLDALAQAGLCGLWAPPAAPLSVVRSVNEILAGACGVSYFVWAQHHGPLRQLVASDNHVLRDRFLDDLRTGRLLGGVAFSHLRRPGAPALAAVAVPGGYRVDGEAPWVTSWGIAHLFLVAARHDGRILWFLLDARRDDPAVRPSSVLPLAAMNASRTVRLRLDSLFVPDAEVISTESIEEWRCRDRIVTAQPSSPALGVAQRGVRLLSDTDPAAAASLGAELAECRDHGYGLADEARNDAAHMSAMTAARAWGLTLAMRTAGAVIAASGGRALTLDHPGQRLLREAAFFSIQAQTQVLRQAVLGQIIQGQTVRS